MKIALGRDVPSDIRTVEAVREVTAFYRVYHSMRYVKGDLVLRLQSPLPDRVLDQVRWEFRDLVGGGTFEQVGSLPSEANEPALAGLPRLKFRFNRQSQGRLRQLIDFLNRAE